MQDASGRQHGVSQHCGNPQCTAAYLEGLRPVDAITGGYLKFSLRSHLSPLRLAVNRSHKPPSSSSPPSPTTSHLSSHESCRPLLAHYVRRWGKENAGRAKVGSWRGE